jgi:hypothetical protein
MFSRKANEGKIEEQFRAMGAKIDELVQKEKEAYPKQVEFLKEKKAEAEKKLKELYDSRDEVWDDVKKNADKAINELQDAWKTALTKLKK